jgi:hypothetical protein
MLSGSTVTTEWRPRVADRGDGLQIWRVAANILNKQSRTVESGWSSSLGVGRWDNNQPFPVKLNICYEPLRTHNEELHNLYSSPDIIRQVKSRRMRWAGHVARMGKERKVQGFGGKARRKETTWKTKA